MPALIDLPGLVSGLNAGAFVQHFTANPYIIEDQTGLAQLADDQTAEGFSNFVDHLWLSQWQQALRAVEEGTAETHFYDKGRLTKELGSKSFGKGEKKDPSNLHPSNTVLEAHFRSRKPLFPAFFVVRYIPNIVRNPFIVEERDETYLRIPPFSELLEQTSAKYPAGLRPRLAAGLVSPLARAILFTLGEYPVSFMSYHAAIHDMIVSPVVVPVHDLYHINIANRQPEANGFLRMIIRAALVTFSFDILAERRFAKTLDETSEQNHPVDFMQTVQNIAEAALLAGAGLAGVAQFKKQVAQFLRTPLLDFPVQVGL